MSSKSTNTIAIVIIVLIAGSGIGYYIGQTSNSGLKEEIEKLTQDITQVNTQIDQLTEDYEEIQDTLQDVQTQLSTKQTEYSTLNTQYTNLQNTYTELQDDYEALQNLIPYNPIDPYVEVKSTTEGTYETSLIGKCGENYIIPAPTNAENWEINITITSELTTQSVHITLYKLIGEYPPDYSAQPLAQSISGTGTASLTTNLDPSYAYVALIRDAYAKPFTGTIEETWYPTLPPSTEIPGITNGDFSEGNEGWYTQGKTSGLEGTKYFYQRYGGTYTTQEITISENQGLSFKVKPFGARFEVQIDGYVIYYGDLGDDQEWIEIIVQFGNTYLGPRSLYFIVCDGEDDGSYIALDDIAMVQFESS